MSSPNRLLSVVGWDGVLPIAVGMSPVFAGVFFQKGHIAELAVAVLIPVVAALVRAYVGYQQLVHAFGGGPPLGRQAAMAIAITLLLMFEATSGVLTCADDEPPAAWLVPISLYLIYLTTIVLTLWPPANDSAGGDVAKAAVR